MHISPLVRNLLILAAVSVGIVVLNQETSLVTAATLLQVGFMIAVAAMLYLLWRDFGRREIELWPRRAQVVFYGAVAVLVIDLAWFFFAALNGLNALAFFLVAAGCAYAAFRTWRDAHRYS